MTPLMALTTCDYDSTMGVGVLDDSPILKPQDLVGKRVASVPTSATYVETTDPVMRYLTELGAKRTPRPSSPTASRARSSSAHPSGTMSALGSQNSTSI
jgi:hypothetical protein